jgi:hypothetical protein
LAAEKLRTKHGIDLAKETSATGGDGDTQFGRWRGNLRM